jgi:hypothetical protein
LTEYGQPLESSASVKATLTRPDKTTGVLTFTQTGVGEFETGLVANQAGAYIFRIEANGFSSRGQAFTREHLLSAVVGMQTPPPPRSEEPENDVICRLLHCIADSGVLTGRSLENLKELGIDVGRLRECLDKVCHQEHRRRIK